MSKNKVESRTDTEFQAFDWGTKIIDLTDKGAFMQMRPVEIHHKLNGTIDNKPSFVIIMDHPDLNYKVMGQVSLGMLNYHLAEIGYKIERICEK